MNGHAPLLGDLIQYCHEYTDVIDTLGLIPLTENWDPDTFETDVYTTREDVEHMVERSVPGGQVEFFPAGMAYYVKRAWSFFHRTARTETFLFGGVHPDCETITLLISDGEEYRSANHYLRLPLRQLAAEIVNRCRRIEAKLSRLDPDRRIDRLRGQLLVIRSFAPVVLRAVDLRKLFKGHPAVSLLRILGGLIIGKPLRDLAHQHMNPPRVLRIPILPFEEYHSLDAARLQNCKDVFAYEDVETGEVKTIPFCIWNLCRNDLLKKIAAKYGTLGQQKDQPAGTQKTPDEPACVSAV